MESANSNEEWRQSPMIEQTWVNPKMDRAAWGPGPWDGEPDKVSWVDSDTGMPCLAVRAIPSMGSWCGYVAVEPGHPLHGKGYADSEVEALEVHGGLTFADSCMDDAPVESAVCHIPEPGKPADVWWFGWDCAHAWDASPAMDARMRVSGITPMCEKFPDITYKTLNYVKQECANLARQLAEVGDGIV